MFHYTSQTSKFKDKVNLPSPSKKIEKKRIDYLLLKSPSNKFVHLTKALVSSKGPFCENRILTAAMRNEKGGVVDLNVSNIVRKRYFIKIPKHYPVKNDKKSNTVIKKYLPKEREQSAKIIQKWWRDIVRFYTTTNIKIVKIQSYYRKYRVRFYILPILHSLKLLNFFSSLVSPQFLVIKKECFKVLKQIYAIKYFDRIKTEHLVKIQRIGRKYIDWNKERREKFTEACGRILTILYKISRYFHENLYMFGVLRRKRLNMVKKGYPKVFKFLRKFSTRKYYPYFIKKLIEKGKFRKLIQNVLYFYHTHEELSSLKTKFLKWKIRPETIIRQRLILRNFLSLITWRRSLLLLKCLRKISYSTFTPRMRDYAKKMECLRKSIVKKWRRRMLKYCILFISKYKSKQWYKKIIQNLFTNFSISTRKSVLRWIKYISSKKNLRLRVKLLKRFIIKKRKKTLRFFITKWRNNTKLKDIVLTILCITEGFYHLEETKSRILNRKRRHFLAYLVVNRFKPNYSKRKIISHFIHKIPMFKKSKLYFSFAQWRRASLNSRRYFNEKLFNSKFLFGLIKKLNYRYSKDNLWLCMRRWKERILMNQKKYVNNLIQPLQILKKNIFHISLTKPFAKIRNTPSYKKFLSLLIPYTNRLIFSRFKACIYLMQKNCLNNRNYSISLRKINRITKNIYQFRPLERCFVKWIKLLKYENNSICKLISQVKSIINKNIFTRLIKPSLRTIAKKAGVPKSHYYQSKVRRELRTVAMSNEKRTKKILEQNLSYRLKHWKNLCEKQKATAMKYNQFISKLTSAIKFYNLKAKGFVLAKLRLKKLKFEKVKKQLLFIFCRQKEVKLLSLLNKWRSFTLSFSKLRKILIDYSISHTIRKKAAQGAIVILKDTARIYMIKKKISCRKIIMLLKFWVQVKKDKAKRPIVLEKIVKSIDLAFSIKKLMLFHKWKRIGDFKKIQKAAKVIQFFIKKKLQKPLNDKKKQTSSYFNFPEALNKLYLIVSSLIKDFENKKHYLFLHWNRKSKLELYNSSSKVIQRFFKRISNKSYQRIFKNFNFLTILNGLTVFHNKFHKLLLKSPFDKIKQEAKRRIIIRFLLFLRTKKINNYLSAFNGIKSYANIKYIVMNIFAKKIQDKFRTIMHTYKIRLMYTRLLFNKKIALLITNNEARIKFIRLKLWKLITSHLKQDQASNAVQKFLRKGSDQKTINRKIEVINVINTLFMDYLILKQIKPFLKNFVSYETFQRASGHLKSYLLNFFLNKIRKAISCYLRSKLLLHVRNNERNNLKYAFKKLQLKIINVKIKEKLTYMVRSADLKTKFVSVSSYFMKWNNNSKKLTTRDASICNSAIILIKLQKIKNFRTVLFIIQFKKLKKVLAKMSAKTFLEKLNHQKFQVKIFSALASFLIKGSTIIQKKNTIDSLGQFYRLYVYKILAKNLIQNVINCYQRKIEAMKSIFLMSLHMRSTFLGTFSHSLKHAAKSVDLSYRYINPKVRVAINISSERPAERKESNSSHYIYVIPILITILQRRATCFYFPMIFRLLQLQQKISVFLNKIRVYIKRKGTLAIVFLKIQSIATNTVKKTPNFVRFHQFIANVIHRRVLTSLIPVNRITKLMRLIKLTQWHKFLAKRKWLRTILAKWSFYSNMKSLSKQKITSLYKGMNNLTDLISFENNNSERRTDEIRRIKWEDEKSYLRMNEEDYFKNLK